MATGRWTGSPFTEKILSSQLLLYRTLGYTGIYAHTGPRISVPRRNSTQYVLYSLVFGYTGFLIYRIQRLRPYESGIRAIDCRYFSDSLGCCYVGGSTFSQICFGGGRVLGRKWSKIELEFRFVVCIRCFNAQILEYRFFEQGSRCLRWRYNGLDHYEWGARASSCSNPW